ncbi:TPA: DNA primase [Clostridioides difficile]|uniref:hypothetical protein n=1 Tax=Clostridioides difficile TaxID=1496 RepID=UPI000B3CADAA|nr:hypothetical protein [Clostridioides difficile]HBF8685582.1 DNA primase [Clostridioides difficile]
MCCSCRLLKDRRGIIIDACELKKYIIENKLIIKILENINCYKIKESKNEFRFSTPFCENSTATRIKKDTLSVKCYHSNIEFKGDIFTLVMKIENISFFNSIKKVHELLNIPFNNVKKREIPKVDLLRVFKKVKKRSIYNVSDMEIYNEDIYSEYIKIPYIGWVKEGILPSTQNEFGIGYSIKTNRVVIPHRYWCGNEHDYLGLIGRTLNNNFEILGVPKYFPLKTFLKSMNLYGLNENYKSIQESGYVNVFESEKSTLKRHSKLDKTGVSLCCHEISEEQAKILISLNVDIVIQMDKDIDINFIRGLCEIFYGIRNVYYVYDNFGLLNSKESPADKHNKIYNFLWNRKVKYDEKEHKKYLRWKEEKFEQKK